MGVDGELQQERDRHLRYWLDEFMEQVARVLDSRDGRVIDLSAAFPHPQSGCHCREEAGVLVVARALARTGATGATVRLDVANFIDALDLPNVRR